MNLGLTNYIFPFIYLSFIIVVIIILFYRQDIGIYYIILFLPLQNVMDRLIDFPFGKDFIDILIVSLFIKSIPVFKRQAGILFRDKMNILIFILVIYTFVHALFLGDMQQLIIWKNFVVMLFLYFIVFVNIKQQSDIKNILIVTAISMFLMGVYFMNNFYIPTYFNSNRRGTGTFSYLGPNELAIFYAWYTPIVIALFYFERNKLLKLVFSTVLFVNIYSLLFTFSRSGYIVFLFSCAIFALKKSIALLIILVILSLTWQFVLPVSVVERIMMTQDDVGSDDTLKQREGLIRTGLDSFMEKPIIGNGFATTSNMGFRDGLTDIYRKSLHNGAVQILVEMGLIGLFIFVFIYIGSIMNGLSIYKASDDILIKAFGFGFFLCSSAALFTLFIGNVWIYLNVNGFFWVYAAAVNRCKYKIEQNDV